MHEAESSMKEPKLIISSERSNLIFTLVHNVVTCRINVLLVQLSRGEALSVSLHVTEMSFYSQHCLWAQYVSRHSG